MKILRIPFVVVLIVVGRALDAGAQTETNLHSFGMSPTDGSGPNAGLVQGSDGNFYGTTEYGGTHNTGTVFRISPGGSYTTLYSFVGSPTDGGDPEAALVQGHDGNFYGTTFGGGSGNGILFCINSSGSYTNLHSFTGYPADGASPRAGLVQGSDGNFYGVTEYGGTNGIGTVFRFRPGGTYTTLYSFVGSPTDGYFPFSAGLVQGGDGDFYGTTLFGGTSTNCGAEGCGTVFRISPSGGETILYSFAGSPNDGGDPYAALVQGSDGNFYGTTFSGGTNGIGTVFRISPSGSETNLYSFNGFDGANPEAGLVQGSDGNFYGTTVDGYSEVFRISPSGSFSNFYVFVGSPNASQPAAGLVQGSDGNFYGTSTRGGTSTNCEYGCGTVFKLTVPLSLPPYPINQITGVHRAGTNVVFNVVSIAGETYQLQFSSSLTPTNWVNVPGVSVTNSIGSILTLTNFAGANQPQGFYRFAIAP